MPQLGGQARVGAAVLPGGLRQAQRAGQIIHRLRAFVKRSEPQRQPAQARTIIDDAVELAVGGGLHPSHRRPAEAGLACELISTGGHPIVYAETPPVLGKPVVLVYGHYDVQPPDPLGEWITPPFEPAVRDGKVFARGATDDKGQMLTHVHGVHAWLAAAQKLPLQVKLVIEGEEEVGSEHLEKFLKDWEKVPK